MAAPRKTKLKVGVIGLGIIGSRAAASLRAAGYQVYVWSRSPRSAPNFLGSMVEVADLSDLIQIFVSDDAALLDVARTIGAALTPRHIVAAHPTISPGAARQAATIVESQGARYLDAPFTGSKMAAQNGQLVYYVGGAAQVLEEARPALEASSKKILHVGEVGQASVLKIATNMLTAATVQTLAEALAVVRGSGISEHKLTEALEFNASRSATADLKLAAMIAENFEPNFSLKHMFKDVRLGLGIANELKIALPATQAVTDAIAAAMQKDWGEQDFSILSELYEKPPKPEPPAPPPPAPEPAELTAPEPPSDAPPTAAANGALNDADLLEAAPAAGAEPLLTTAPAPAPPIAETNDHPVGAGAPSEEPRKSPLQMLRGFLKKEQVKP